MKWDIVKKNSLSVKKSTLGFSLHRVSNNLDMHILDRLSSILCKFFTHQHRYVDYELETIIIDQLYFTEQER